MEMSNVETVYKDDNFSVVKEEAYGVCFFHCYVDHFNKSVLKTMREVWEDIKEEARKDGWRVIHSYTPNPKFANLLPGAKKINEFEAQGKSYEVIEWDLEHQL